MKIVNLYDVPYEVMLILEHPSGVLYENQVGGEACGQARTEGVLAPIALDPDAAAQIMSLPYISGRGLTAELADAIDDVLAGAPGASYLRVDRSRLADSSEAWVFVTADVPESAEHQLQGPYLGAPRGFGRGTGVLTWPNSD